MIAEATALEPIYVADSGTPEWFSARKTGIGASTAAAVCGVSRYDTPLHAYLRIRGEMPEVDETDAMRLGKKLEPVVISEFCEMTGHSVQQYPCPMYRHPLPECHFMLATPDALLANGELLEAKTTTFFNARLYWGDDGTDDLPDPIVIQIQQQLAVTGREVGHAATLVDGRKLHLHRVERNDRLINRMMELEAEFWQRVVDGNPPEPQWGHKATPDLIKEMHNLETGETVILPAEIAAIWRRKAQASRIEARAKKRAEALRAQVAHAIGNAAVALFEATDAGPNEFELTRSIVRGGPVTYMRDDYFQIRQRKSKG
jgi:putative phage-type endonuclease